MIVRVIAKSNKCKDVLRRITKERLSLKEKIVVSSLGISTLLKDDGDVVVLEYTVKRIPSSQLHFFVGRNSEGFVKEVGFIDDQLALYGLSKNEYSLECE